MDNEVVHDGDVEGFVGFAGVEGQGAGDGNVIIGRAGLRGSRGGCVLHGDRSVPPFVRITVMTALVPLSLTKKLVTLNPSVPAGTLSSTIVNVASALPKATPTGIGSPPKVSVPSGCESCKFSPKLPLEI